MYRLCSVVSRGTQGRDGYALEPHTESANSVETLQYVGMCCMFGRSLRPYDEYVFDQCVLGSMKPTNFKLGISGNDEFAEV